MAVAEETRYQLRGSDLAALIVRRRLTTRAVAAAIPISSRRLREILRFDQPSDRDLSRVLDAVARLTGRAGESDELTADRP